MTKKKKLFYLIEPNPVDIFIADDDQSIWTKDGKNNMEMHRNPSRTHLLPSVYIYAFRLFDFASLHYTRILTIRILQVHAILRVHCVQL